MKSNGVLTEARKAEHLQYHNIYSDETRRGLKQKAAGSKGPIWERSNVGICWPMPLPKTK